jgi:hypothetical protein
MIVGAIAIVMKMGLAPSVPHRRRPREAQSDFSELDEDFRKAH